MKGSGKRYNLIVTTIHVNKMKVASYLLANLAHQKNREQVAMVLNEDYSALVPQLETLLAELDRLQLPLVAVHVDMALARLKEAIAGSTLDEDGTQARNV